MKVTADQPISVQISIPSGSQGKRIMFVLDFLWVMLSLFCQNFNFKQIRCELLMTLLILHRIIVKFPVILLYSLTKTPSHF